jgi:hypothetical protein
VPLNPLYSFSDAKDEVTLQLGNRSSLGTRVDRWLDAAQARIARSRLDINDLDDTATLTLAEDVAEYDVRETVPALAEIVGIKKMRCTTTGYRLRRFPWDVYRTLTTQTSGDPLRWTRDGYIYAFDPVPDESVDILVDFRRNPEMGVSELDNAYQLEWIKMAVFFGWQALDETAKADAVLKGLPALFQQMAQTPLRQDQWEAGYDSDLSFGPSVYGD